MIEQIAIFLAEDAFSFQITDFFETKSSAILTYNIENIDQREKKDF